MSTSETLPHDDLAERGVIGGCILDNRQWAKVAPIVCAADFYRASHAILFRAISALAASGAPMDLITVRDWLQDHDQLEAAGGFETLAALVDGTARSANVAHYARMVREKHARRAFMDAGEIAGNGSTAAEVAQAYEYAKAILDGAAVNRGVVIAPAVNLSTVAATYVEHVVTDYKRRVGVGLTYGQAGVYKTLLNLRTVTEMESTPGGDVFKGPPHLFGCAELAIRRPWRRVVLVSAEETAGAARAKWNMALAGMGLKPEDVAGEILFVWPFGEGGVVTLDRTNELLDSIGGDFDAMIYDSWTSLVPAMYEGRAVEWDRDNIATRHLMNQLRDVAERRQMLIDVVHHEGKNAGAGLRGPSELRNSADTVVHLEKLPERRVKVKIEKQRDGRDDWYFTLAVNFTGDAFHVRPEERKQAKLTGPQQTVLAFVLGRGRASVAEVVKETGLTRSSVQRALDGLQTEQAAVATGEKDANGSVIWGVPDGAHEVPAHE